MTVAQILKPLTYHLDASSTLADVAREIESNRMAAVFVEDNKPIGVITRRDYIRLLLNGVSSSELAINFAKKDIIKIRHDRTAEHALTILIDHGIRRLIVVDDNGDYLGTISYDDIIDMMAWVQKLAMLKACHVTKHIDFLTFKLDTPLSECAQKMLDSHKSVAVVLQDNKPIGVITESDLIDKQGGNRHLSAPLRSIMHTPAAVVKENDNIDLVMQTMHDKKIHSIVVVDDNDDFIGVVTSQGIAKNMEGNYNLFLEYKVKALRDTLDNAPYIIIEMEINEHKDYVVYWANQVAIDAFSRDIIGSKGDVLFEGHWAQYMRMFEKNNKVEKQIVGLNSKVFELSIRKIYDDKIQFTLNDISNLKRLQEDAEQAKAEIIMAEEAIRHANAVLYKTLNSIDALVYVIDVDTYEILFVNGYAQSIFGSVSGKTCYQTLQKDKNSPCDFCPMVLDLGKKETGSAYSWENKNSVNQRWYRFNDRHIKWIDGRKVNIHIGFDITNEKDAAEELAWLNSRLSDEVSEEKQKHIAKDDYLLQQSRLATMGSMLSAITHQWRQPLNALALIAQDLPQALEYGELNERYLNKSVETMMEQIKYLNSTVDDFREFYRPHKEKETFDVCLLIAKALEFVSARSKQINVNVLQNTMGEECNIVGYSNEAMQAIINILNNAIENFEIKGSLSPTIAISGKKFGENLTIIIEDNGGGIDEAHIQTIFEPFFTTKEDQKGTGLGLYLTKLIIEKMGGSILAENGENGARFSLTFVASANS